MTALARIRRLGGVSLIVLSAVAAGAALQSVTPSAEAYQRVEVGPISAPAGAPMSFADLIEAVSPAVVEIQVDIEFDAEAQLEGVPPQFREWLERQFGDQQPQPQQRTSLGSGFFISGDGHVVTNNHVVENATEITIGLSDGTEYPARVIGTDPQTDLALLKIDADVEFPYVQLDRDPQFRVGDWVVAVGNPFGLGGTATAGIISATGREIPSSTYNDFLQIDAPINRGNSGGPTFDLEGNVIGVNSQIFSPSGGNVGIGFAIPSDSAARIIDQLLDDGRVSRGWLGVTIQNVTPDIAESLGMDEPNGAIVSSIVAGGPADRAGFERRDVVLTINGEPVEGSRELTRRIGDIAAGDDVRFGVLRDGDTITVRARLGDRPSEDELGNLPEQGQADVSLFGMRLAPADDEVRERLNIDSEGGLVVDSLEPNGEAARKGLRSGDVILEAGGQATLTIDDFTAAVADAREDGRSAILLLVQGIAGQRYVALQIDEE